jgi:hypothetical protein
MKTSQIQDIVQRYEERTWGMSRVAPRKDVRVILVLLFESSNRSKRFGKNHLMFGESKVEKATCIFR